MTPSTPSRVSDFMFWLALVAAVLALLSGFALAALQAYIRWTINQDFTFLGGFGLEALIFAGFGMLYALLTVRRV